MGKTETISFYTEQDLYVGQTVVGYEKPNMRSDRVIARLDKLLIVCPDTCCRAPGFWLCVKAEVTYYS
jgi:hypothetical protein